MADSTPSLDFDAILRNTQARIRAYIAGFGIAAHEVDDLAQEVYLQFFRGLDRVPPDVSPQRWLKGIARNVCLNHIRRTARRGRLQREALTELLSAAETELHRHATEGTLAAALEDCCIRLPEESRRLLDLKYRQDLTSDTMGKMLGRTAEAIRIALYRVRTTLKQCIGQQLAGDAWP